MDALRPDPRLLERPVVEASEAEVGLVVVVLEEETVPAGVVGASPFSVSAVGSEVTWTMPYLMEYA